MRAALLGRHPATLPHDTHVGYDYGLYVGVGLGTGDGNFYAVPALEHGGNTMTMTSSSVALPEQRLAVSVLANGAEEELSLLTGRILSIAGQGRFPEPTPRPQLPPPASDLSVYAGAFTEPNLGDIQLSWADAQLQIEIPRLDELGVPYEHVLVPARLDVFDWSAAGEPMSLAFYAGLDGSPNTYALGTEIALTRATRTANP